MPLTKLDNFIKNTEGRTIYVNPDDLDSSDSITNQGNSLARPFKTIQRALIEAARFSYVKGSNNDIIEKTTILLFPGEHLVDNRPGFAIYDNGGAAYAVSRAGGIGVLASSVLSLGLDSNFDLQQESNDLYKFNSYYGGAIIPRGVSIIGLDLRKTKIRPKYVPNPTDPAVDRSAVLRITGTCYLWQYSMFDGDPNSFVYTDPDDFSEVNQSLPNFSHHKLSCFEYADGVNNIGTYGLTDLDMYYSKVSNAFNAYRDIDQKFPSDRFGFAKMRPEWEIVGAFATDPINIANIIAGNGFTANSVVTVTTNEPHGLTVGTPIKISGVGGAGITDPYNVSTTVQNVLDTTSFTYLLPSFASYPTLNPSPSSAGAQAIIETDTVSGASPYIFNISLRSVWGMQGLLADGDKAAGFKSTVLAQFTGISLQKDDRAFVKYNPESRTYESIPITTVRGSELPLGASSTDTNKIYHIDQFAIYRKGWETTHIEISNDGFSQLVSIFAIGFNRHFHALNGGDHSITNSNSNFGQLALVSTGFKKDAFGKDNHGYITSIIPPRDIELVEDTIEWLSLDVSKTITVGVSSHLYITGFSDEDVPPAALIQGYRVGARENDKLYVESGGLTYSADIYMVNNVIGVGTVALGAHSSKKEYDVLSGPTDSIIQIGPHDLLTGESVKINSDTGDLPENITAHATYYVIDLGDNDNIQLAASLTNATQGKAVQMYKGTNLRLVSRVAEKDSGDFGSPIQYDSANTNWFIHTNADNEIFNAFDTLGTAQFGDASDLSYVNRIADDRSIDERLYKVRVVIPKEIQDAKDPEPGFVIQESSSTGVRNNADFTRVSLASTDYEFQRNPRFIATCSETGGTVTVFSELPHGLQSGDVVKIVNVTSSTNTTTNQVLGFNGRFEVTGTPSVNEFTYGTTDVLGIGHSTGIFQNDVTVRNTSLPRFEREDLKTNLFVYRNEIISNYIYDQQDGIYHIYFLNSSNYVPTEFTDYAYGQVSNDLYPQLDRDNINANPPASKTFAKRDPIGAVVTNDLKKSITRESIDRQSVALGIGQTIASVERDDILGITTVHFTQHHNLAGIVTYHTIYPGSGYNDGTFRNVKLYDVGTENWRGATAEVVISGGSVTDVHIISPGSGYLGAVENGSNTTEGLDFDQTTGIGTLAVGAGITISRTGIATVYGNTIQITGDGFVDDSYYRIHSLPSSTSIAFAHTTGDPVLSANQYLIHAGPSVKISSSAYTGSTGITNVVTTTAHGVRPGNSLKINDVAGNSLGSFIVQNKVSATEFTIKTSSAISAVNGYVLKEYYSANQAPSDVRSENFGVRHVTFYDSEEFTLTSNLDSGSTLLNFSHNNSYPELRLPLGSYIQIDQEVLRVLTTNNTTQATVLRGAFGTRTVPHAVNSLIKKIKPIAIEFRRPSIIRASGHTFEYLGYGPGNYSTGLPSIQLRTLTEEEEYLSQAQERTAGQVVYTGMNNRGDFYIGNNKKSSTTGEEASFDIPIPTVTGESAARLSAVFDDVTIRERLLVEGGSSGQVLSQFDGPVTFNKNVGFSGDVIMQQSLRLKGGTNATNTTTGDLVVSGGAGFGGNLHAAGSLTLGDTTQSGNVLTGSLITPGGAGIGKNLNVGGDVDITGVTTIGAGLNVDADFNIRTTVFGITVSKFSVDNATGDTTLGDLYVNGNTTLVGSTNVYGSLSGDTHTFNGNVDMNHDLNVDGTTTLDDVTIAGTVDLTGQFNIDNIRIDGNAISVTNTGGDLDLSGNGTGHINLNDDVDITNTLDVGGVANFDDTTQASSTSTGAVIIDGGVGIAKNLHVGGTVDAGGGGTFGGNGSFTGSLDIGGTLDISTGNLILDDRTDSNQGEIRLGNSADFVLYHNATNSFIDNDTGHLYIRNNVDNDDGSNIYIQAKSGENSILIEDDGGVTLYYDNTQRFATTNTGCDIDGELTVSGDITAFFTSDERLKDNITRIEDPLAKVLSISGNTYDWNENSGKSGNDVGLIAQELREVLPEAVVERDNGYLAVDYHKVIPLLVESIKELSAKVDALEHRANLNRN
jgi:hypothetical protein